MFTFGGGAVMGWLTILRLALAAWKLVDGWKDLHGRRADRGGVGRLLRVVPPCCDGRRRSRVAVHRVVGDAPGPRVVAAVRASARSWRKLKSAVNAEVYQMIVEIVRQAIRRGGQAGSDARTVSGIRSARRGVDSLPGGMTSERTASGATTIVCFALILGLAATASAAPPKAFINGPSTGTPGELLTLDASQSEGDDLKVPLARAAGRGWPKDVSNRRAKSSRKFTFAACPACGLTRSWCPTPRGPTC